MFEIGDWTEDMYFFCVLIVIVSPDTTKKTLAILLSSQFARISSRRLFYSQMLNITTNEEGGK